MTYGDLRMIRAEFDDLMQLSVAAGTIKHPIAYETYVDETFAKKAHASRHCLVGHHETSRHVCGAVGLHAVGHDGAAAETEALKAGVFNPPREAPDFSLRGSDGAPLTLSHTAARWCCSDLATRHCPNVCPVTLAVLAQAHRKLGRWHRRCR